MLSAAKIEGRLTARMSNVLVIGASGGIGTAIGLRLKKDGYRVAGTDRVDPPLCDVFDTFIIADLAHDDGVDVLCSSLITANEQLWGIVFCSGIYPIQSFTQYSSELWDEVNHVNLKSVFLISQRLVGLIPRGGRVVIVASGASHIGSRDIGYSSTKAGAIGLMRGLCKVLAPDGILVNAVAPGVIKTAMSERMESNHIKEYLDRIPLGRMGSPDEIAVCISFLLFPENSYMTGSTLDVNGGLYSR